MKTLVLRPRFIRVLPRRKVSACRHRRRRFRIALKSILLTSSLVSLPSSASTCNQPLGCTCLANEIQWLWQTGVWITHCCHEFSTECWFIFGHVPIPSGQFLVSAGFFIDEFLPVIGECTNLGASGVRTAFQLRLRLCDQLRPLDLCDFLHAFRLHLRFNLHSLGDLFLG